MGVTATTSEVRKLPGPQLHSRLGCVDGPPIGTLGGALWPRLVGVGGGDAVADGGRVDATPPPPPTPAGEREDGTGEVTADVVVAVNVPDGRS